MPNEMVCLHPKLKLRSQYEDKTDHGTVMVDGRKYTHISLNVAQWWECTSCNYRTEKKK